MARVDRNPSGVVCIGHLLADSDRRPPPPAALPFCFVTRCCSMARTLSLSSRTDKLVGFRVGERDRLPAFCSRLHVVLHSVGGSIQELPLAYGQQYRLGPRLDCTEEISGPTSERADQPGIFRNGRSCCLWHSLPHSAADGTSG